MALLEDLANPSGKSIGHEETHARLGLGVCICGPQRRTGNDHNRLPHAGGDISSGSSDNVQRSLTSSGDG